MSRSPVETVPPTPVKVKVELASILGLPGETPELAKKTVQNAIDLDPEYAQFSVTCPFPGTILAEEI